MLFPFNKVPNLHLFIEQHVLGNHKEADINTLTQNLQIVKFNNNVKDLIKLIWFTCYLSHCDRCHHGTELIP